MLPLSMRAQYNIDRLLTSGQMALHYEDYVLSIQYFNQIISLKPHLYLPWHLRGVAKYYLDDYVGAESDATEASGARTLGRTPSWRRSGDRSCRKAAVPLALPAVPALAGMAAVSGMAADEQGQLC